jgi:hypothetical protein
MVKIGWIGLQLNTFHLGSRSVGKQPSTSESVRAITTVNSGGTFAMTEGQALILIMTMLVGGTLVLNGCANLFVRII